MTMKPISAETFENILFDPSRAIVETQKVSKKKGFHITEITVDDKLIAKRIRTVTETTYWSI